MCLAFLAWVDRSGERYCRGEECLLLPLCTRFCTCGFRKDALESCDFGKMRLLSERAQVGAGDIVSEGERAVHASNSIAEVAPWASHTPVKSQRQRSPLPLVFQRWTRRTVAPRKFRTHEAAVCEKDSDDLTDVPHPRTRSIPNPTPHSRNSRIWKFLLFSCPSPPPNPDTRSRLSIDRRLPCSGNSDQNRSKGAAPLTLRGLALNTVWKAHC